MDARAEILRRVKAAARDLGPAARARTAQHGGAGDLPAAFEAELRALTAVPHRAESEAALAQVIAGIIETGCAGNLAGSSPPAVVAWSTPLLLFLPKAGPLAALGASWTFASGATPADRDSWRQACIGASAGITEADYALADTGTLVLLAGPDRPRLASLLPPVHVAVVRRERILPHLDALFEALAGNESAPLTLITGPSRTADIEKKIVLGVHGPETLHVVTLG